MPLLRPLPPSAPPSRGNASIRRRAVVPPLPMPAPLPAAPDIRPLGQSLFGCAPEALAGLPPDQRAACARNMGRAPGDTELMPPKSHVRDPQRRAAEMRARNAPGRIPCAVLMNAPAPYGGTQIVPGFSPACVLDGLIDGFGPLNGLEK